MFEKMIFWKIFESLIRLSEVLQYFHCNESNSRTEIVDEALVWTVVFKAK